MAWTKTDIRTLRQQIDTFALFNRAADAETFASIIDANRVAIILSGLRVFRAMFSERETKDREAAEHFRTHPNIYGDSTPEMIERFTGLAADAAKAGRKLDAIVKHVETEPLPDDVATYQPTMRRSL
jgi:hypothetical protein